MCAEAIARGAPRLLFFGFETVLAAILFRGSSRLRLSSRCWSRLVRGRSAIRDLPTSTALLVVSATAAATSPTTTTSGAARNIITTRSSGRTLSSWTSPSTLSRLWWLSILEGRLLVVGGSTILGLCSRGVAISCSLTFGSGRTITLFLLLSFCSFCGLRSLFLSSLAFSSASFFSLIAARRFSSISLSLAAVSGAWRRQRGWPSHLAPAEVWACASGASATVRLARFNLGRPAGRAEARAGEDGASRTLSRGDRGLGSWLIRLHLGAPLIILLGSSWCALNGRSLLEFTSRGSRTSILRALVRTALAPLSWGMLSDL